MSAKNSPKGQKKTAPEATNADAVNEANTNTESTGAEASGDEPNTNAGAEASGDAEATPKVVKDIVPAKYRDQYAANKGTCGDFIALELQAIMESDGIDSLALIKAENGIPAVKWSTLNNGQQRMNVSNALRAAFLRGEVIKIRGKEHSLDARMDEFTTDPKSFNGDDPAQVRQFLAFLDMPENTRNTGAIRNYFFVNPKKALDKAKRVEEAEAKKKAKEAEKAAKAAKAKDGSEPATEEKEAA